MERPRPRALLRHGRSSFATSWLLSNRADNRERCFLRELYSYLSVFGASYLTGLLVCLWAGTRGRMGVCVSFVILSKVNKEYSSPCTREIEVRDGVALDSWQTLPAPRRVSAPTGRQGGGHPAFLFRMITAKSATWFGRRPRGVAWSRSGLMRFLPDGMELVSNLLDVLVV